MAELSSEDEFELSLPDSSDLHDSYSCGASLERLLSQAPAAAAGAVGTGNAAPALESQAAAQQQAAMDAYRAAFDEDDGSEAVRTH